MLTTYWKIQNVNSNSMENSQLNAASTCSAITQIFVSKDSFLVLAPLGLGVLYH